jgi:hypothetical protein
MYGLWLLAIQGPIPNPKFLQLTIMGFKSGMASSSPLKAPGALIKARGLWQCGVKALKLEHLTSGFDSRAAREISIPPSAETVLLTCSQNRHDFPKPLVTLTHLF